MNMKLLEFVAPLFIYHGCYTRKTFWKGKITPGGFTPVNMKNCGHRNVKKHRDINNGENYITLDILLKFGSLDKMKITSSEQGYYLGISGKGLITSLGLKTIGISKRKKARYAITNVSMEDLSKLIKVFENFLLKSFVRKRPKHEPTDSYFYIARQISKCMMIDDAFNFHVEPVISEMTGMHQIPILHVCSSYKSKSKGIIEDKDLLQVCYTDEIKSESIRVDDIL